VEIALHHDHIAGIDAGFGVEVGVKSVGGDLDRRVGVAFAKPEIVRGNCRRAGEQTAESANRGKPHHLACAFSVEKVM
jgi:hypothetical protein